jgi:hypothetical protein
MIDDAYNKCFLHNIAIVGVKMYARRTRLIQKMDRFASQYLIK